MNQKKHWCELSFNFRIALSIESTACSPIRALCVPKIREKVELDMVRMPNPIEIAVTAKKNILSYHTEPAWAALIAPKQNPVNRLDCVVID